MKRFLIFLIVALLPTLLFAQDAEESAIILYLDDPIELQVFDSNDFTVENPDIGTQINPGDRLVTGNTSVEVQLQRNGSIVRIDEQTTFRLDSMQGRDGAAGTEMTVPQGRVRMVAARLSGQEYRYAVRTPGAVAGVRGTDFGVHVIPGELGTAMEELFVFSGEVLFSAVESGQEIFVAAGQRADLFAENFLPVQMSAAEIAEREQGLGFEAGAPDSVPGNEPAAEPEEEAQTDVDSVVIPDEPEPATDEPGAGDQFFGRLAQMTGMQVGSVTINGETYAQAVFQPRVSLGKLSAGFYLPITYTENLFDPGDWYRPGGNDEWSFGTDQDWSADPLAALGDVATDLALKIKYLEYGDREADRFFVKVGNLNNFTLGQGLLMQNYANDVDFPVVRRVGFQMGADFTSWGFEAMVNDFTDPFITGGRLFFRPAPEVLPVAIGFTGITDLSPGTDIATTDELGAEITDNAEAYAVDPLFLNVGVDLSIPVLRRDLLSLTTFAEAGGMIPYLREEGTTEGLTSGLQTDALVDLNTGEVQNFGWIAGIRGKALIIDYRLEFRSFDGTFRPAFYDSNYDRLRAQHALDTVSYLRNPNADEYQSTTMGVFGQAGANLFDLAGVSAGYFWPWEKDDSGVHGSSDDELLVNFYVMDGLIPLGITAGLEYRRTHFAATIGNWGAYADAKLFDANTTLDGYVAYPLTEQIRLVGRVSTAVKRDGQGNIVYDDNENPVITPVVVIQTEIGL